MPVQIIAEVGVNHQNDLEIATQLIAHAQAAGATAVKFQASTVLEEVSLTAAPDHFADLGKLVPTWDFLRRCKALCDHHGIEFICTPAGLESLEFVVSLGVQRLKVASDNLTNTQFLEAVARTGLPVILSTGMGTLAEVRAAIGYLRGIGSITLLHCVSAYPCPADQLNLAAMVIMQRSTGLAVGLSDHTRSMMVPALAVAAGAVMIEKHFTLDNDLPGPDHKASLDPAAFKFMVDAVLEAEAVMGDGRKAPMPVELENMKLYRKSVVAAVDIAEGEVFTPENLTVKRPGSGRPAFSLNALVGLKATRSYAKDDLI